MSDVSKRSAEKSSARKSRFALSTLLERLLSDLATSGLPITRADMSTLARRCAGEGESFMFKTLKQVTNMLLETLENKTIPAQSFFRCSSGTKIPLLFEGLWLGVVSKSGSLLPDDEISPQCVAALLQIGSSLSKYEASFPKELIPQYLDEFVSVDEGLGSLTFRFGSSDAVISVARSIVTRLLSGISLKDIVPRHGPGAVATGEKNERKWEFKRLYADLHELYPYHEYFVANWSELSSYDRLKWFLELQKCDYSTAKLIIVPKTAESLRPISMEPSEKQFIQQGQMSALVRWLKTHWISSGQINFDDQTINQQLALIHSRSGRMATIDLSSASDRLSLELVQSLLLGVEDNVLRYLLASRSRRTLLPDGREVVLNKFAPMGSATCFPVQSICFFALSVASISIERNQSYEEVVKDVFVFGDDIIVPSEHVGSVTRTLEYVGLKVNYAKTFSKGLFRESCGMFAFNGRNVTPTRFKKLFPRTIGDGRGWSAWIEYAHACEAKGYSLTAEYIYESIEDILGKLPYGLSNCGYFCRLALNEFELFHGLQAGRFQIKWSKRYQRLEIKAYGVRPRKRAANYASGWHRLFRNLVTSFSETDPSLVVVDRSTKTKAAWHPIL